MGEKIRFGGKEVDGVYRFELNSGHFILDFINTLDERRGNQLELIKDGQRFLQFLKQSGVLSSDALLIYENIKIYEKELDLIRHFREELFELLSSIIDDEVPNEQVVASLNKYVMEGNMKRNIKFHEKVFRWEYIKDGKSILELLWPIIYKAIDLLIDESIINKIKRCEGQTCAWLFIDNSRKGNRRWCDMSVCGNREKIRRYRKKCDR